MSELALELRPASLEDAELLLRWRNDPSARSQFFDPEEVKPDAHARWLMSKLEEDESRIYVAELDGRAVGQARIDRRKGDTGEISVSVDAGARGLGVGRSLIARATSRGADELRLSSVEAIVKETNEASLRAFRSAGYLMERHVQQGDATVIVLTWQR